MNPSDKTPNQLYNDEITIGELIVRIRSWLLFLWSRKRFIASVLVITITLALIIDYGTGTEYEAENVIITYTRTGVGGLSGNLSGLAGLAALSTGDLTLGGGRVVTENMLPNLITTYPVGSRLANQPLRFYGHDEELTAFEYFTEYYQDPALTAFFNYIRRTPRRMLSFMNPPRVVMPDQQTENPVDQHSDQNSGNPDPQSEQIALQRAPLFVPQSGMMGIIYELSGRITIENEGGFMLIRARMPDPYAAADLAQVATDHLLRELINFEIRKTRDQLNFLEEEYNLSKERFERAQVALADFLDRNQGNLSAMAQIERQRLQNDLDLAFDIYSSWTRQVEETRVKLREDTPVFTEVDPVQVPSRPVRPTPVSTTILATFLGLFWGIGFVTIKQLYNHYKPADKEENQKSSEDDAKA